MAEEIVFCAYKKCPNVECLRFYRNAPKDISCSWFGVRPKEDGSCDYKIKKE